MSKPTCPSAHTEGQVQRLLQFLVSLLRPPLLALEHLLLVYLLAPPAAGLLTPLGFVITPPGFTTLTVPSFGTPTLVSGSSVSQSPLNADIDPPSGSLISIVG